MLVKLFTSICFGQRVDNSRRNARNSLCDLTEGNTILLTIYDLVMLTWRQNKSATHKYSKKYTGRI